MAPSRLGNVTRFAGARLVARGAWEEVARAARADAGDGSLIFDDESGRVVDIDLRTSSDGVPPEAPAYAPPPARGRPKLGVVAREVTLLPRHWAWLAAQPGGASAALRRLVDLARRESADADAIRQAQEAAYRVMTTVAGDRPNYEEATRALFARDRARFADLVAGWPKDIVAYLDELSEPAWTPSP